MLDRGARYRQAIAPRKDQQNKLRSPLQQVRVEKGVYRHQLAEVTGISYSSLRRLEVGLAPNAPLWWYQNCAIALGVDLENVLDYGADEWQATGRALQAPDPGWISRLRSG
jgi:DNA-binding Xre family transcriptional regulator